MPVKKINKDMKKKPMKKTTKKITKPVKKSGKLASPPKFEPKKSCNKTKYFLLGFLTALILGAIIFGIVYLVQNTDKTVLIVNGEEIKQSKLDEISLNLMQQIGEQPSLEEVKEQAILEVLILQEAEKMGLSITMGQAEQELYSILQNQGMDIDTFKEDLIVQNVDYQKVLENYRDQLIVSNYVQNISAGLEVTEAEIEAFYEENKEFIEEELEVVSADIENLLMNEKISEVFKEKTAELKEAANIIEK